MIALLGRGQAYDFFPIQLNPFDLLISDVTYNYKFAIILFIDDSLSSILSVFIEKLIIPLMPHIRIRLFERYINLS